MELIEKITDGFEKSKFTVGTYIDLKKAFDTIDHSILLEKLQCYGIRGLSLNWINSFLSNRTQFTNYDSVRSEMWPTLKKYIIGHKVLIRMST